MMNSTTKPDLFSKLPQSLLVLIISFMPFKDAIRTSVISKTWRNLCRETKNLVFKESEFVRLPVLDNNVITSLTTALERELFVMIMRVWISKFRGVVLEKFELCLSQPKGFGEDIISLLEFAASLDVKNVVLDFSDLVKSTTISPIQQALAVQNNEIDIPRIFFNLIYVETLTICHIFLQMIQDYEDDVLTMIDPMETQHVVMKTNMNLENFIGIGMFLSMCPKLETLTFDVVNTTQNMRFLPRLDPNTYWATKKTCECLMKTLKVLQVRNFHGTSNELHVLEYLVRHGRMIERLDLYEARELDSDQKKLVLTGVEKVQRNFKRASKRLQIILHSV